MAEGKRVTAAKFFVPPPPPLPSAHRETSHVNDKKFLFNCYGGISFWETSKLDIVREKAEVGARSRIVHNWISSRIGQWTRSHRLNTAALISLLGASPVFEKSSSFVIRTKVGQKKWRKKGGRNLSRISSEKDSGCVWNRNKIENRLKLSDAPDSKHQSSLRRINFSNATRSLPFPPLLPRVSVNWRRASQWISAGRKSRRIFEKNRNGNEIVHPPLNALFPPPVFLFHRSRFSSTIPSRARMELLMRWLVQRKHRTKHPSQNIWV